MALGATTQATITGLTATANKGGTGGVLVMQGTTVVTITDVKAWNNTATKVSAIPKFPHIWTGC